MLRMMYDGRMTITITLDSPSDVALLSQVLQDKAAAPAPSHVRPNIMRLFPAPMDDDARTTLFAAWGRVFNTRNRTARERFTRTVLGLSSDTDVSWRNGGPISQDQAYYMARVLNVISDIDDMG